MLTLSCERHSCSVCCRLFVKLKNIYTIVLSSFYHHVKDPRNGWLPSDGHLRGHRWPPQDRARAMSMSMDDVLEATWCEVFHCRWIPLLHCSIGSGIRHDEFPHHDSALGSLLHLRGHDGPVRVAGALPAKYDPLQCSRHLPHGLHRYTGVRSLCVQPKGLRHDSCSGICGWGCSHMPKAVPCAEKRARYTYVVIFLPVWFKS